MLKTLIEDARVNNKEELISCMQDRVVWRVKHVPDLNMQKCDNFGRLSE